MLIVNNLAQLSGVIVSVAIEFDLLTDRDATSGERERCHALLMLLVDLLRQSFLTLLGRSSLPLFQSVAIIVDFCDGFQNGISILRSHSIKLPDASLAIYFFRRT